MVAQGERKGRKTAMNGQRFGVTCPVWVTCGELCSSVIHYGTNRPGAGLQFEALCTRPPTAWPGVTGANYSSSGWGPANAWP